MSQFTSQWDDLKKEIRKNSNGLAPRAGLGPASNERSELLRDPGRQPVDANSRVGSSGWTRTSNPVNRLMQVQYLVDSSWL
jgi:hypothetical protein